MTTTKSLIRRLLIAGAAPALLIALIAPLELLAQRTRSGGAAQAGSGVQRSGGGQRTAATSTPVGASMRQSSVNASGGSGVNRSSVQSSNINRNTNVNANTNVNVNRNTNVNVNNNANVHNRDWEGGSVEGVYVGEEHAYVKTEENRVWVGEGEVHVHEDNEAWKVVAGVATVAAIGTMLATPPPQATTVVVQGSSYYYDSGSYYTQVYSGGEVVYQAVAPPVGAVVTVLPAGCSDYFVGNVQYHNCGGYYYQPQGSGYVVVRL